MKKGDRLFARIDYRIKGNEFGPKDFDDHTEYLEGVSRERYFAGGGFAAKDGGMILFKAKDIEEAKAICDKDPIIDRKLYKYELYEWNLVIVSDEE
ncbi:YciI family protein [Anaeromicrobium sediminis]|uniref:YCII-related domain-containing protein n=1 Tax=Anaeromicrobium sediminis TaxID=1478221 RepID=A0A267MCV1_9FIRM|nr:YciI family protein [Anaeromicrobium sediminis]PAB57411.1 hypothetical protein CCE28_19135 [Anaeromicrobium sediminis]